MTHSTEALQPNSNVDVARKWFGAPFGYSGKQAS